MPYGREKARAAIGCVNTLPRLVAHSDYFASRHASFQSLRSFVIYVVALGEVLLDLLKVPFLLVFFEFLQRQRQSIKLLLVYAVLNIWEIIGLRRKFHRLGHPIL